MLHFPNVIFVFMLVLFVVFVCVAVACIFRQSRLTIRRTDKSALIYVENRFKLLLFNSANVIVNPALLAPIYKSDIEKTHLHRSL